MQNAKYTVLVFLDIICWEMLPANKSSETPYSDVMLFLGVSPKTQLQVYTLKHIIS